MCSSAARLLWSAVDDDAFWEGVTPLDFGSLPKLQDTVAVVGYPIGGDTISVTVGVVSRIEVCKSTGMCHPHHMLNVSASNLTVTVS